MLSTTKQENTVTNGQGRCNGVDTRGWRWIVPAHHRVYYYLNVLTCVFIYFGGIEPLLRIERKNISRATPSTFSGLIVTCRDREQRRGCAFFVTRTGPYNHHVERFEPLKPAQRKPKSWSSEGPIIFLLELLLLSARLTDRCVREQVGCFDLSPRDWLMLDY